MEEQEKWAILGHAYSQQHPSHATSSLENTAAKYAATCTDPDESSHLPKKSLLHKNEEYVFKKRKVTTVTYT